MTELSLKDLQKESLEILKDVHAWCVKNNVMYSVGYGTLLGTIRHKGFIPWDDDIDIIMYRRDYERFCRDYTSERYKLLWPESTNDYYLAFARVFDCDITITQTRVPWHDGENGVWIDIFPIDLVPDDKSYFEKFRSELHRKWETTLWGRQAKCNFNMSWSISMNTKLLTKKIMTMNGLLTRFYLNEFMKKAQSVTVQQSRHWSQLTCMDGYEWHCIEDFQTVIELPFEDTEVMVMNGYDNVLRECFGDYMQLPPEENRVGRSDGFTKFYWK